MIKRYSILLLIILPTIILVVLGWHKVNRFQECEDMCHPYKNALCASDKVICYTNTDAGVILKKR